MKQNIKTQKGNIEFNKDKLLNNFKAIPNYFIKDNRLTNAEKGILTALYMLPDNWKITLKATSNYLNISEKSFIKYLKKYKQLGYIEIEHIKNNDYKYKLNIMSFDSIKFEPKNIKSYTVQQLLYFASSQTIETKYKNLIKKTLKPLIELEEEINKNLK